VGLCQTHIKLYQISRTKRVDKTGFKSGFLSKKEEATGGWENIDNKRAL
jgi:hypothetical protein